MKYETREGKDKAKKITEIENDYINRLFGAPSAEGRERFKDLKIWKKKRKK